MSLLSKLFGGGKEPPKEEAVEYGGFRIYPEPSKEAQGYRIGARIEMDKDGEVLVHNLIRADTISDHGVALQASVDKAKQMIDQVGKDIFK